MGQAVQLQVVDDGYVPQRTTENIQQIISQGQCVCADVLCGHAQQRGHPAFDR